MSLYNISTQQSRDFYSTTGWDLNTEQIRINQNESHNLEIQQPEEFYRDPELDQQPELSSDRYSLYSNIKSSTLLDKSNQDTTKTYFDTLPITIRETTKAFRENSYNPTTNTFITNRPNVSKYFAPAQQITTTFNTSKTPRDINTILFLPENYTDEFATKEIILIPQELNVALSASLSTNVYTAECDENCVSALLAHFIQPSYDSENTSYDDVNNFGISFNNPSTANLDPENSILTFNIKKNNEIIISVVYNEGYANTQIVVKHPLIENYEKFNLTSTNSESSL